MSTAGQPPCGAAPSGVYRVAPSCTPSPIVRNWSALLYALAVAGKARKSAASRRKRRPTAKEGREMSGVLTIGRVDRRPIGVFDSGMGGLTVLHECLVTMPHEDFLYLGDGARLPYGPRPLTEIRRFAAEIAGYLEEQGVKLVVAACNAATSAALPELQERLHAPIVGVITPEAHAAVQATRNRRVGLLATHATVSSGRYAALVHTPDAGVELVAPAC